MSTLIDDAVRALHNLPEEVREAAARAILDYEAGCEEDLRLSDAQADEIARRVADPDRSFLSLSELAARLRRPRA